MLNYRIDGSLFVYIIFQASTGREMDHNKGLRLLGHNPCHVSCNVSMCVCLGLVMVFMVALCRSLIRAIKSDPSIITQEIKVKLV